MQLSLLFIKLSKIKINSKLTVFYKKKPFSPIFSIYIIRQFPQAYFCFPQPKVHPCPQAFLHQHHSLLLQEGRLGQHHAAGVPGFHSVSPGRCQPQSPSPRGFGSVSRRQWQMYSVLLTSQGFRFFLLLLLFFLANARKRTD